ncbi:MAG: hypothetical protein K6G57_02920 [Lachnospiraceae bacterium]|nr:hypothetical protein [Lachnospiraceae bacterium]
MMTAMRAKIRPVDVICQHSMDGSVTPMRIRAKDDDGEYQTFSIKRFRDVSHQGAREMPDGVYVSDRTFVYECYISIFGREKMVRLYYEPSGTVWKMTIM